MSTALIKTGGSLAVPVGNLDAYINSVYQMPVLSVEEEQGLALRFREHDDLEAARQLVVHHLRFVVHVARGYSGYGLALADLIQEGNIGLMKSVKRFDPTMNVRLVSFAVHWIRAEMHEYILRNWKIVKVATTKAQRKLFFNLRGAKKRLGWMNKQEVDTIAQDLGVTAADVMEMESRLNNYDIGFDGSSDDDDDKNVAPAAYLTNAEPDPAQLTEQRDWDEYHEKRLHTAMSTLDERSKEILKRRWLTDNKSTLHELAAEYSVSAERIRQIESSAMKKLRGMIEA